MVGEHCPCIAISHGHKPGECDEPMPKTGHGQCLTCRYPSPPTKDELLEAVARSNLTFLQRSALRTIIEASE